MAEAKKDDKKDDKGVDPALAAAKKKKVMVLGGAVGGLALAFAAAMMAVPKPPPPKPELSGPFVGAVTPEKVQVNLSDGRSFLVLQLNLLYEAYAQDYLALRTADPVCQAEIRDALVAICSSKSRNDVTDKVNKPVFLEEIRHALEPLLFPVHVGDGAAPGDADPTSGLKAGESMPGASFGGLFEDHRIALDVPQKKLTLDGGLEFVFTGEEADLELKAVNDQTLFLDLTGLKPEFVGEVKVGIKGRTKRILWNEVLIQ
ncbi:MAG: flagellar basal body-associated FliL family protein [Planctomycetes bacterium]|nr:flagellar basal body-associated FliL family protein [Planctomycetota bacterium]